MRREYFKKLIIEKEPEHISWLKKASLEEIDKEIAEAERVLRGDEYLKERYGQSDSIKDGMRFTEAKLELLNNIKKQKNERKN